MTIAVQRQLKVLTGFLDEHDGNIVLRGVLDPRTLDALLTDDSYQREAGTLSSLSSLLEAYTNNEPIPDIELGMRGQKYRESKDGSYVLLDQVFMIDGLQRITAARHFLKSNPDATPRIGFTLHFETNRDWEANRFEILNTKRNKVAPNVLVRGMKERSRSAAMLYGVSNNEKDSTLFKRVSWNQKMQVGELISAMTLARTVGIMHGHVAAARYTSYQELIPALDRIADIIGLQAMRDNVRTFFEIIDQCWGIRLVTYRDGAAYLRGTFLMTLARVFSDHEAFWKGDGKRLFLDADTRRKLQSFKVHDPHIKALASSSGKSRDILYNLIVEHLDSGKRQNRLTKRKQIGFHPAGRTRGKADAEMSAALH